MIIKNKILILVESLIVGGGSERFGAILGSKLYDEGYNITYLTLMEESPKYQFKGDYYTLNEGYIYGNIIKRTMDLFRYAPKITRLCNELDIDTIISVSEVANFHAVLSRVLYGNKVRIITSQHMNPEIFLESKLKSSLIKFFYPHADRTVCVSKEMEKVLNEQYNVKNTQTIYNMMDIEENIQLSLEKLPEQYQTLFKEENFNFINVARLTRQKGQWFLLRSFRRVVDQHPHARLFILGEGVLRREVEDLIRELELTENVYLLGNQSNIFPFLKHSDCFVFSSLWEGLPLVLIEALSMDIPIISCDCKTGPKEILCPELDLDEEPNYPYLGKYAILTEPFPNKYVFDTVYENPLNRPEEKFANTMIEIIENPDLRKEYSNGKVRAEKFDNIQIVAQWNELLEKLPNTCR
jgi:glycosyltransferase involved in cell wall biosynthesis